MEIRIVKGSSEFLNDCEDALVNSELGAQYFSNEGSARKSLQEGFSRDEIYVALDNDNHCRGFFWYINDGIFHSFPYLHIIAIKPDSRGHGIGKELMRFFEDLCFDDKSKVFLVVADFNPKAKKLYESIGYVEVGTIPSLYRKGITEHLMMKARPEK